MGRIERSRAKRIAQQKRRGHIAVCAAFSGLVLMMTMDVHKEDKVLIEPVSTTEIVVMPPADEGWEDQFESEKIEQALLEQGYFRNDVPLTYEEQDYLHTACEESGVPYALALAVIEQETGFRNAIGDDGTSAGYMQVQERWHWDRMERLGVADLGQASGNFRVGCDFLAELCGKYPVEKALTAYNSGKPGESRYSREVMEKYEAWKELVGDDVCGIKG